MVLLYCNTCVSLCQSPLTASSLCILSVEQKMPPLITSAALQEAISIQHIKGHTHLCSAQTTCSTELGFWVLLWVE